MFVGSLSRRWANCARALSLLLGLLAVPALAQYEPSTQPSAEVFGGVSYFRPNGRYLKSDASNAPSMKGWGASIYTPFSGNVGGVFDISGNYGDSGNLHSIMFGAEYKPKKWTLQPFGEGMMGWAGRNPKHQQHQGSAAFAVGGGVDLKTSHHFAVRLFRVDYIHSFDNPGSSGSLSGTDQQTFWNSIRIQSGVVWTIGGPRQEQFVAALCTATPDKVRVGEPVSAKLTPKGFARPRHLSYEWQVNEAKLGSTSADAVIETASLSPGTYTVKATASNSAKDKHHLSAACTATFAVLEVPKQESPATGEAQASVEPAKTESRLTESAAAKTEAQPATETTATASAVETKLASSSAPAETAAAPAVSDAVSSSTPQPPQSAEQAAVTNTAAAPAAQEAPATSDAQPLTSTPAAGSAQTPMTQEAPKQEAHAIDAATSDPVQPAQPTQSAATSEAASAKRGAPLNETPAAQTPASDLSRTAEKATTQHPVTVAPASKHGAPALKQEVVQKQPTTEVASTTKPAATVPSTAASSQVRKLNPVRFNNVKHPARVDDVAKQTLRDAAHALQQSEPGSKLIVVGNARASELHSNKNLPERRADNAKAFLMDRQNGGGVDSSSITTYRGKANARRVDIYLAAPGATFNPSSKAPIGNGAAKSKRQTGETPELRWHGILEK